MNEVQGDLFKNVTKNQLIVHVCNDMGGWGAGFVIPLGRKYPCARDYYTNVHKNLGLQLGTTQFVKVDCDNNIYVANMIAQTLGGSSRPLYYNHLARCMDAVAKFAVNRDYDIICPRFGSALAGGNWEFIKELIYDCWVCKGINVTVYYL